MKLSALLLAAYLVPATAQTPAPDVVIPADAFNEIRTEFAKMRLIIELQQKRIDELRQRYECT